MEGGTTPLGAADVQRGHLLAKTHAKTKELGPARVGGRGRTPRACHGSTTVPPIYLRLMCAFYFLCFCSGGTCIQRFLSPSLTTRPNSFVFYIHFCQKAPTLEVALPLPVNEGWCSPSGKFWIHPCYG